MKNYKTLSGRTLISILILAMIVVFSTPASVLALNEPSVTEVKSSALSDALDYDWKVSTSGSKLTLEVRDSRAGTTGDSWYASAYYTQSGTVVTLDEAAFSGTTCTATYDFSAVPDGIKNLVIQVYVKGAQEYDMWTKKDIFLKVSGGQVSIYSPYGQSAIDYQNKLNSNYKPADYSNPAVEQLLRSAGSSYVEIVTKAKELTAGKSDAEKVLAIHDWICENFAYDHKLGDGDQGSTVIQSMYTNRRGICGHFTMLTTLMCRAAGIPCISIEGRGTSLLKDGDDKGTTNHAWNAVYVDNSWHFIDTTWDCNNDYYGDGDSKTTSGKEPSHFQFDLPAAVFGARHVKQSEIPDLRSAKGIEVKSGIGTRHYLVGQSFDDTAYRIAYVPEKSSDSSWNVESFVKVKYTGFDSSKEGEQTITVSANGFTTQFTVTVYKKTGIKAVPKEGVTYKKGESFTPEYELYYTTPTDKTFKVSDKSAAKISGYDINKAGKQTVTVEFDGFTTTFDINVEGAADYDRIAANPISGYTYLRGEDFTPKFKLYGIKNGKQTEITDLSGAKLTFDKTKTRPTVTVEYEGLTTTFDIATIAPTGITFTPTTSTKFKVGDEFKAEGQVKYKTATGTQAAKDPEPGKITFSGYDMSKAGKQTVKVTYKVYSKTYETTFDINVLGATGITVTPVTKTYKVGDTFKPDFKLYYKMSDNTTLAISDPEKATVTGYDMSKAGTQTVTVKYDKYTTTYNITVKDPNEKAPAVSKVSLSKTSYTYTGKSIVPAVTAVDADGNKLDSSDYSVVYSNNKNVGTAKATITFKGDYADNAKVVKTFTINPKGTTVSKVTAKSKKLVVSIKAQKTQTTGYEVRYSLKKTMAGAKTVKVTKNSTTTAAISKLQGKKTYYVQVRTYKTVSGKPYYSGWSKAVAKTTLK
ncbi:MAG: bacterial Ig-like domain-containing protein [Emergencia sp.]